MLSLEVILVPQSSHSLMSATVITAISSRSERPTLPGPSGWGNDTALAKTDGSVVLGSRAWASENAANLHRAGPSPIADPPPRRRAWWRS